MPRSGASDSAPPGPPGYLPGQADTGGLPEQVITSVLAAAVAAPSMHNTQPWSFQVLRPEQAIEVHADPARGLRYGDPHGRAVHIACGAALFNMRLAAAVAGREPVVRLLPEPGQPLLLATLHLAGRHRPQDAERELHAAITRRHTNRRPFSDRAVPPGVRAELAEAARLEGAILHFPGYEEALRLLELVRDCERDLSADPAYRAELAQWAGGARDREGIPDSALGSRSPDGPTPVRDFTPGRPAPRDYEWFEETPQLAVLSMSHGGPADWLRAGQALQRVLLTATGRGISASPLTQPLETADAWLVRDPRSGSEQPQMILRIGYGLPVPATPRRPIAEALEDH